MTPKIRFRKSRASGVVCVGVKTPRGIQWISTGQTSHAKARGVVDEAMVERLQMAACANALTPDVISRLMTGRRFSCQDILEAWKVEVSPDISPDTLSNYETAVRQFLADTGHSSQPISAIRRTTLSGWVNAPGVSAGSRRARLAALRSYYRFASAAGYCVGNPADLVTVRVRDLLFPEIERKETLPLTADEYTKLMTSSTLHGFYRWATALGYWLGLRLRDVACLEWASIKATRIIVHTKKTGARVALPVDDSLLGAGELRRIILEMLDQPSTDPVFCFPEQRAVALDPQKRAKLSVQFQRVLRRHGIVGKRYHSCRHAFAVRLNEAGKTLEQIGELLGHASKETTKIYTDHASRPNDGDAPRQNQKYE